jgi:hypothetical protein
VTVSVWDVVRPALIAPERAMLMASAPAEVPVADWACASGTASNTPANNAMIFFMMFFWFVLFVGPLRKRTAVMNN